ncbi:hypothetical protein NIIDNTM18_42600 [Mycolicibacterium litorale]|uniref:Uncharacterized protein n=1 Tax=Mycolicibacterium litorale TaxID=758802 RepID=A0A6S6PA39_9MYCO|nr:hypothetical protein NIIDNTM18_42600 [Mycolicibacterium litorale]
MTVDNPKRPEVETGFAARAAVVISNWLLRTFAPNYSKIIEGAIRYALIAAAEDYRNEVGGGVGE